MTRYVLCMPVVLREYGEACKDTLSRRAGESLMEIDNTHTNRGVAASWNLGINRVLVTGADWLVLCSAAMRFGLDGGDDFLEALDGAGAGQVEGGDGTEQGAMGWHLVAFHRDLLVQVGYFDEQWHAYQEDVDYSWRMQLAAGEATAYNINATGTKMPVDARLESVAHGICLAHTHVDFVDNERRFAAKWLTEPYRDGISYIDGKGRGEHLRHPYDRPDLGYTYVGPPLPRWWQ